MRYPYEVSEDRFHDEHPDAASAVVNLLTALDLLSEAGFQLINGSRGPVLSNGRLEIIPCYYEEDDSWDYDVEKVFL